MGDQGLLPSLRGENPQLSCPGRGPSHPLLFLHGLLNPRLWAAKTFLSPPWWGQIATGLLDTTWDPSTLGSTSALGVLPEGAAPPPPAPLGACFLERQELGCTPALTASHWLALGSSWAGCRVFLSASPCPASGAQQGALDLGYNKVGTGAVALLGMGFTSKGHCLMLNITSDPCTIFLTLPMCYPLSSFNNQNAMTKGRMCLNLTGFKVAHMTVPSP